MNTIQTDRSNLGKHIFSCLTFQDQEIDVMQYKSLGSLSSCSLYLSSFCNFDQVTNIDQGRWPTPLNALFNGVAPYFFLTSIILIFLPVFLSKLCLARDIFACDFFRPLSRLNFSVANVQGLALFMIIFSSR
jgi:hypothetical protein